MEDGTAHIIGKLGQIRTRRPPSPVNFEVALFPTIVDGENVHFTRFPTRPDWASAVYAASTIAPLVSLAGAPARLTHQARAYLLTRAAGFVTASQAAPADAPSTERMARAEAAMKSVARLEPEGKVRIGVQAVRSAIDEIAPDTSEE